MEARQKSKEATVFGRAGGIATAKRRGKKGRAEFARIGATARWEKERERRRKHDEALARRRERDRARRAG